MTRIKSMPKYLVAISLAYALVAFMPVPAQAQIGISVNLGGPPVYEAPPPEYIAPAYVAPAPVYGPEYVPDYYDYHHRPVHRPPPHPHGNPHGGPPGHHR